MSEHTTTTNGIGFLGLLTIVFIVLKLTNIIGWSWWWVTAPLWIPAALFLVFALVGAIIVWRRYKNQ